MSFNYLENYKDYLTDDYSLVLDLDSLCYNAAASAEERYIEVIHKVTKKGGLKFTNKTEFYGKGKDIGGWLLHLNENRLAQDKSIYEKSDFEIIDKQKPEPLSHAIRNLQGMILSYVKRFECNSLVLVIEDSKCINFRNNIPLQDEYKGNRKSTLRPYHLKSLKQYVYEGKLKTFLDNEFLENIILSAKNKEADDLVNILQTKSSLNYKKTNKHTHLICGVDKDILSNPHGAMLWNTQKDNEGNYIHPYPFIYKEGLGKVWGKSNTVKGYGLLHFSFQILLGDMVDNYNPKKGLCKKQYGAVKFLSDIESCNTAEAIFDLIEAKYKEWFPNNSVKFDWKGNSYNLTVDEWLENQFKCVYMKRSNKDNTTYKSFRKEMITLCDT